MTAGFGAAVFSEGCLPLCLFGAYVQPLASTQGLRGLSLVRMLGYVAGLSAFCR